jgi:hypothetical protein
LLIGGAAALAYFATRRKPIASDEGDFGCNPTPYNFNRQQVVARIDNYLDDGRRDPGGITQSVANDLFNPHPTGAQVAFPPVINAQAGLPLEGVQCVFDLVGQTVLERMDERGIEPGPDPQDDDPIIFTKGKASDPGYPWTDPKVQVDNYPTPGMFFIVGQPTMVGGNPTQISSGSSLVRAALGSAMAMAQNFKPEWVKAPPADAPANHPYFNNDAKRLRQQMARLIRYSPWNDQLYGQTDPNKAGGSESVTYMMEPCGRGLNWLPRHADNIGRLGQGKQPLRTTTLQGNKLGNGGSHQMQLWIPAVNLDMLRGNVPDASLTVTTNGMTFPTGDATLVPPPIVWGKGIENPIGGAASWGCPGVA